MLKRLDKKQIFTLGLLAAILLQLVAIGWYQYNFFLTSAAMDSDGAAEILLAEHLHKTGEWILSKTWFYSTEIRVLHNQLLMRPLFLFTQNYSTVAAWGAVLMAALLAAGMFFCVSGADAQKWQALLAGFLAILPYGLGARFSYFSVFIGNAYYGFFMLVSLMLLGLYLRVRTAQGKRRLIFLALLTLLAGITGLVGERYAIILIAPLLAAQLLHLLYKDRHQPETLRESAMGFAASFWPALPPTAGWLVGYLLFRVYFNPVYGGNSTYYQLFIESQTDLQNGVFSWLTSLLTFTGFTLSGGKITTLLGLLNLVLLGFVLSIVFCAVLLLKKLRTLPDGLQFYIIFAWCAFFINSLSALLNLHGAELRYYWLGFFWLLPCPVLAVAHRPFGAGWLSKAALGGLLAAVFLTANVQLAVVHSPYASRQLNSYTHAYYRNQHYGVETENRMDALAYLRENNYTFGAATFWNANISTILTEGDLRVVSVGYDEGRYQYYEFLVAHEYTNLVQHPPQFLLLRNSEVDTQRESGFTIPGTQVYQDGFFTVFDLSGQPLEEIFFSP